MDWCNLERCLGRSKSHHVAGCVKKMQGLGTSRSLLITVTESHLLLQLERNVNRWASNSLQATLDDALQLQHGIDGMTWLRASSTE